MSLSNNLILSSVRLQGNDKPIMLLSWVFVKSLVSDSFFPHLGIAVTTIK
jgi:hypothetical protein